MPIFVKEGKHVANKNKRKKSIMRSVSIPEEETSLPTCHPNKIETSYTVLSSELQPDQCNKEAVCRTRLANGLTASPTTNIYSQLAKTTWEPFLQTWINATGRTHKTDVAGPLE